MCPLYPVHTILVYAILFVPIWLLTTTVLAQQLHSIKFEFKEYCIHMDQTETIRFTLNSTAETGDNYLFIESKDPSLAKVDNHRYLLSTESDNNQFNGSFMIYGNWLGKTEVSVNYISADTNDTTHIADLPVTVIRRKRFIDDAFTASVIILVSILYINFGCALDWSFLMSTIKKPIGPLIGCFGQFVVMPLLSFGLGRLLFPNNVAMQLGLFFTGVSPAGGASNIWTYILGGNLNLSIAMTTISTFAAFGMMPLWLFTLGRVIFNSSDRLQAPYAKIAKFAVALVVPLGIGYWIQKRHPKVCKIMVRLLKPAASCLLVFIIVFAIITNTYLFELFSWQIIVAGLGLPWLGYFIGMICAVLFKQSKADTLAIAIETGIQNTGISIFLLRLSLDQPEADLTTVVPVAVAIMTPIPLMIILLVKKIYERLQNNKADKAGMNGIHNIESQQTVLPSNGDNGMHY